MYRDQVIALLKDQLTLEVETVSNYDCEGLYQDKNVINLCLDGETISTVVLEDYNIQLPVD